MVQDLNRTLGRAEFSLEDRYDVGRSREMFRLFLIHYRKSGTLEEWARMWNGGPRGYRKKSTLEYWSRVERVLKEQNIVQ